jgi:RNA polymerase sigma factor (TIGR02999 family)
MDDAVDAGDADSVGGLLARFEQGDRSALDALIPLVYQELRSVAHRHRRQWTGGETFGTTALVNEAYLKLAQRTGGRYVNRSHFLAVASRAMRQILIDSVRSKNAAKRGGGSRRVPLDEVEEILRTLPTLSEAHEEAVLALNESLQRLEAESERHCRIVECRFFGGMTVEETAEALDISPATVKRGWSVAQAWLRRELGRDAGNG